MEKVQCLRPDRDLDGRSSCRSGNNGKIHAARSLKIRTFDERYDPGGGGVNVARVIFELGGQTLALFASGGVTGRFVEEMLTTAKVPWQAVPIRGACRISVTVRDQSNGQESAVSCPEARNSQRRTARTFVEALRPGRCRLGRARAEAWLTGSAGRLLRRGCEHRRRARGEVCARYIRCGADRVVGARHLPTEAQPFRIRSDRRSGSA